jgi:tRNA (adenine57-N1/adenine58-N1)-methyltransferase
MTETFSAGDQCLLIDGKKRRFLMRLKEGGSFHSHHGVIDHDDLIGSEDGTRTVSTGGAEFVVLRPRLSDYVLKMRRGAQVVYPKDLGPILVYADIAPGSVVLEAGTGSGALTLGLLRAVGPSGRVVSVERRDDHADHAQKTISRWLGGIPDNLELRIGEVEDQILEVLPDRIVLDVPEPWHSVEPATRGLNGGGVFCAYVPTVPQLQQTVEALRMSGCFEDVLAFEALLRTWNVQGRSVRPDHQMVGHTGFICVARKVAPGRAQKEPESEDSGSVSADEDESTAQ